MKRINMLVNGVYPLKKFGIFKGYGYCYHYETKCIGLYLGKRILMFTWKIKQMTTEKPPHIEFKTKIVWSTPKINSNL